MIQHSVPTRTSSGLAKAAAGGSRGKLGLSAGAAERNGEGGAGRVAGDGSRAAGATRRRRSELRSEGGILPGRKRQRQGQAADAESRPGSTGGGEGYAGGSRVGQRNSLRPAAAHQNVPKTDARRIGGERTLHRGPAQANRRG